MICDSLRTTPPWWARTLELDRTQLLELVERTEGWAAELVLAGQSIRRHGATVDLARGSDRLVADYLVDELKKEWWQDEPFVGAQEVAT